MVRTYVTYSSGLVLRAIAAGYRYGFDVMDVTGLPSGTVYPALRKLERVGFVRSSWEGASEARQKGRPARRYYELTGQGSVALVALLRRFPGLEKAVAEA